MDLATAVAELEAEGTEQNRKVYRRHGARDPMYGVSFAVLRPTGEARRSATRRWPTRPMGDRQLRRAPPRLHGRGPGCPRLNAKLDAWLAEIEVYVARRHLRGLLASLVPGVRARADRWSGVEAATGRHRRAGTSTRSSR